MDRIRAYRSNFQGSTGERVEPGRYAADHDWIKDTLRLRHASSRNRKPLATLRRPRWGTAANASMTPIIVLRKIFRSIPPCPSFPPLLLPGFTSEQFIQPLFSVIFLRHFDYRDWIEAPLSSLTGWRIRCLPADTCFINFRCSEREMMKKRKKKEKDTGFAKPLNLSVVGGIESGFDRSLNIPRCLTGATESHPLNKYLATNTVTIVTVPRTRVFARHWPCYNEQSGNPLDRVCHL